MTEGEMTRPESNEDRPQGRDVYQRLIEDIRSGRLQPGSRLKETELAERLGISRTPIREAIRALESDGLVVHEPRMGATIRKLDRSAVSELYDMRAVLEATAARFAARAGSQVELENIQAIHGEMEAASEATFLSRLNEQFHLALLDAARNRFLVKSVGAINTTLLILGPSTLEEIDRAGEAIEEHAVIIAALKNRDEKAAEMAMAAHIGAAHRARLRQFRVGTGDT